MVILRLIYLAIPLALIIAVLLLDLLVRKAFKFRKAPHASTPESAGVPFQEIRFPTRKGKTLYGWWMPAPDGVSVSAPTVILAHGWGRNVERVMRCIEALHQNGFNLLAFDFRGHGSRDADAYPNMMKFSQDIRAALDYLEGELGVDVSSVGVLGLSVGGAAAIHAASVDSRIQRVVTVGAFAHPIDAMVAEFRKRGVPYFPLVWLIMHYLQLRMNIRFHQIAPVHVIAKAAGRFLLIHGEEDKIVPFDHGVRLERAAVEGTAQLWALPGRGHSDCHMEPGFWDRVETFLEISSPSLRDSQR